MADTPPDLTSQIPLWGAILAGAGALAAYFKARIDTTKAVTEVSTKVEHLTSVAEEAKKTSQENRELIAEINGKLDVLITQKSE